jgi:formamidopyrimidine-DNA glycosylase
MPELPEVETVARQLAPLLAGRTVRRLRVLDPLLRNGRLPSLAGRTIREVTRSGKRVLIGLSRGSHATPLWLAVHLRMTGRLLYHEGRPPAKLAHLRAVMQLDRGHLLFVDPRRFGTFHGYRSREDAAAGGVEPLAPTLSASRLGRLMQGSAQPIKSWLLRQDRLVGLGNIYASEILHASGIAPTRAAGSLDAAEHRRLLAALRTILRRAIRNCGTTFSDFQDARGAEGSYQHYLAVYDRAGEPCRRCRAPIARLVQQQRSTYYCARCQS